MLYVHFPPHLSQLHQHYSQSVLALPVAAIAPELILAGMLHKFGLSSFNQQLVHLRVLLKFKPNSFPHHVLLYLLPVLPEWCVGVASQPKGLSGTLSSYNDILDGPVVELPRLVEVLGSWVVLTVEDKGRREEIAEETVVALSSVELNHFGQVLFANQCLFFLHNKRIMTISQHSYKQLTAIQEYNIISYNYEYVFAHWIHLLVCWRYQIMILFFLASWM